jgi:hypothetical protein
MNRGRGRCGRPRSRRIFWRSRGVVFAARAAGYAFQLLADGAFVVDGTGEDFDAHFALACRAVLAAQFCPQVSTWTGRVLTHPLRPTCPLRLWNLHRPLRASLTDVDARLARIVVPDAITHVLRLKSIAMAEGLQHHASGFGTAESMVIETGPKFEQSIWAATTYDAVTIM